MYINFQFYTRMQTYGAFYDFQKKERKEWETIDVLKEGPNTFDSSSFFWS